MRQDNEIEVFAAKPEWASRLKRINEHEFRNAFQRDRDRLLYSKEFRRLSGKTQVFATGFDDNMRTRLTHTLEVAQIANTISKALSLNTELTEAIALGHDVGHTPFGHVGERTLNYIMNGCYKFYGYNKNLKNKEKGFKHNLQGARVVCQLESMYDEEPGLNLTKYTIWGIVNHTSKSLSPCDYYSTETRRCRYKNSDRVCKDEKLSLGYYNETLVYNKCKIINDEDDWTLEGIVVSVADEIAQRHHDIEDGIYAGLIDKNELTECLAECFTNKVEMINEINNTVNESGYNAKARFIAMISKQIIDMYVREFIESARNSLLMIKEKYDIMSSEDYRAARKAIFLEYKKDKGIEDVISFSKEFSDRDNKCKEFLKSHVLQSELAQSMDGKASYIIRQLVKAYLTNPQQLPDATIVKAADAMGKLDVSDLCKEMKSGITITSQARKEMLDWIQKGSEEIRAVLLRTICDFIAGMTDQYAYKQFEKLYGTSMMSLR